MGQNHFAPLPSALYGMVLLLAAIAYYILQTLIVTEAGGAQSRLGVALGKDWKGKLSPLLYLLGIIASFFAPTVASGIYVLVALMWLIPDRRLERMIQGGT
jgi:uncharacterized membrane protein